MPTRYSSGHSVEDAKQLAENLKIRFDIVSIDAAFGAMLEQMAPLFADQEPNIAEENIQARLRGVTLMALANKQSELVLATGNKSELAVGYCTLYGDMVGGFSVLKDVLKTTVYKLANYVNDKASRAVIPLSTLERAPSAELRPDQKDSDSLPPYDLLDRILKGYVEEDKALDDIVAEGFVKAELVQEVIRLVDHNEFKRRQSAPGVKITHKAFGRDRRLPITNRYR